MSVNFSVLGLLGTYPYHTLLALLFAYTLSRQLRKSRKGNRNGLPLPPGPKGYPLIGNLLDVPIDQPWLVYDKWCQTYGKTLMINGLSSRTLFLY